MISLHVKFQPSSTPPSDRFWWGVLLVLVLLVVVTWVYDPYDDGYGHAGNSPEGLCPAGERGGGDSCQKVM